MAEFKKINIDGTGLDIHAKFADKDENGKDIKSYVAGAMLSGTDLSLYDGEAFPIGSPIDLSGLGGGGRDIYEITVSSSGTFSQNKTAFSIIASMYPHSSEYMSLDVAEYKTTFKKNGETIQSIDLNSIYGNDAIILAVINSDQYGIVQKLAITNSYVSNINGNSLGFNTAGVLTSYSVSPINLASYDFKIGGNGAGLYSDNGTIGHFNTRNQISGLGGMLTIPNIEVSITDNSVSTTEYRIPDAIYFRNSQGNIVERSGSYGPVNHIRELAYQERSAARGSQYYTCYRFNKIPLGGSGGATTKDIELRVPFTNGNTYGNSILVTASNTYTVVTL